MFSKFLANTPSIRNVIFRSFSSKKKLPADKEVGFIAKSKKRREILPLVGLVIFVMVNKAWFFPYLFLTRQEGPLYLGPRKKYPFDLIETLRNPTQPKLLQYNQIYEPLPDLAQIYENMQKKEEENEECEEDDENSEEKDSKN